MDLNSLKIKTEGDLESILKFLEDQGFGYISPYDLHNKKIDKIINTANKLNIKYDSKLKDNVKNIKDYEVVEKEVNNYFSKFGVDDKIYEYTNIFHLSSDERIQTPSYNHATAKEIVEWFNFKNKYKLTDEFGGGNYINFFNLDKNYLKINFGDYKSWEFKRFYNLIFGEDCTDFDDKKYGVWQNIGKIELKLFANNSANIKGDLTKFKEYYYQYIKSKFYNHTIIKYNGKLEIFKKKKDD